jgi:predicted chitinase
MEKRYDGRGYVQLTWWDNYVKTGFMIGVGLDLLFDPDLAFDPKIAYKIISTGMLKGQGFANGHKFQDYFRGEHTDYVGARAMVNGKSGQHEIGGFAERFERVLRASASGAPVGGSSA